MGEKRIGSFSREDMGDIVDLLANWRLMLGVTSDATKEELVFITQFVYENYKHFTLSDMKMAKDWTIMGKIEVGFVTQKTFSSYYISRCLNAYEDYKRAVINEIDSNRDRYIAKKSIENPVKLTPQQEAESFKEYLVAMYQTRKDGREMIDLGNMMYNWCKKAGLVQSNAKLVSDAMAYATAKYREQRQSDYMAKGMMSSFVPTGNEEEQKKRYARLYMIGIIFDSTPLSVLIQKIKPEQFKK